MACSTTFKCCFFDRKHAEELGKKVRSHLETNARYHPLTDRLLPLLGGVLYIRSDDRFLRMFSNFASLCTPAPTQLRQGGEGKTSPVQRQLGLLLTSPTVGSHLEMTLNAASHQHVHQHISPPPCVSNHSMAFPRC